MKLYHYTSLDNLQKIIKAGYINLTASNLLKPVNPHLENGSYVDETDSYKPVVWLTDLLDFETAIENGLTKKKTEAVIIIESNIFANFKKWDNWSDENNMDKSWKATLIKAGGKNYKHWYISETPIKIEGTKMAFRPDIEKELLQDN